MQPDRNPHQWSSRGMTTSLVVGRSEPGCGLPHVLSFKDVHHPRWGGGRAELGSCLPHGLVTRFFPEHSGEKGVHQPCGGGELRLAGSTGCRRRQLPRVCLLGLDGFGAASGAASCYLVGAWLSVHRTGDGRAVRRSATSTTSLASPAAPGGGGGGYKTSYAAGGGSVFLDGLLLTPAVRTGARTSSCALGRPPFAGMALVAGGHCRRC